MEAGESVSIQLGCTAWLRAWTGPEGMGNSGRLRRGQHLLPDGATAREQQRKLIEEARAARRGEQIAQPQEQARIAPRLPPRMSQPSRSQLDRMEVPFYPDDLLPKMQQLLAILNDLDHRYETDRYNLQSWSGPQATKEHLLADLERCHRANRERFEACLEELHRICRKLRREAGHG